MNKTLVNAAEVCRDRNAVHDLVLQPLVIEVVPSKAVRPCGWLGLRLAVPDRIGKHMSVSPPPTSE
jgi:hypothetical protein